MTDWSTDALKELIETRFESMDRALVLQQNELSRRLDVLNHAHEQAREKERDFISREAFETFVLRVTDELAQVRKEIQQNITGVTQARETAATVLADSTADATRVTGERFSRIENVQAKMIGGLVLATFVVPLITGVIVYVLTRHAVQIAPTPTP